MSVPHGLVMDRGGYAEKQRVTSTRLEKVLLSTYIYYNKEGYNECRIFKKSD
jgi:hypothetical protein